jgi:hypothetical protein
LPPWWISARADPAAPVYRNGTLGGCHPGCTVVCDALGTTAADTFCAARDDPGWAVADDTLCAAAGDRDWLSGAVPVHFCIDMLNFCAMSCIDIVVIPEPQPFGCAQG